MKRIKLTKEEKAIEATLEEYIPVNRREFEEIAQAISARRKDAVLNIRLSRTDLDHLKGKAKKLGVKYQTFLSEVLHRVGGA